MRHCIILTTLLNLSLASVLPDPVVPLINGGALIDITEAPYTVALLLNHATYYYTPVCGGAVINPTVIVTVASCTERTSANRWLVRAGSTFSDVGGQQRGVDKKYEHERFDNALDNDICLLFLDDSLVLGAWVEPAVLPERGQEIATGSVGYLTGWGAIKPQGPWYNELRRVALPVLDERACADAQAWPVSANAFCAGHLEPDVGGPCPGDGGGPLVVDGLLVGLSSWGHGCGRAREPGVFTRVPNYREWIEIVVDNPPRVE